MPRTYLLPWFFSLSLVPALLAQDPVVPEPWSDENLLKLIRTPVISASGFDQATLEAPAKVVVVGEDEIRLRGYQDLEEVLRDLAGFDFNRTMGVEYSTIFMRGFRSSNSDRFLLIWDGVIQNDVWKQSVWISRQYPLGMVKRVEIMYGPASLLHGANAFSGIINVFLKTPAELERTEVRLTGGAYRTRAVEVNTGYTRGDWRFMAQGRLFTSEEFSLQDKFWTDNAGRKRYYNLRYPEDYARPGDPGYALDVSGGTVYWANNGKREVFPGTYEHPTRDWFFQAGVGWRGFDLKILSWTQDENQGAWYTPQKKMKAHWIPTANAVYLTHEAKLPRGFHSRAWAIMRTSGIDEANSSGPDFKAYFRNDPADPLNLKVFAMSPNLFLRLFNREYRFGELLSGTIKGWETTLGLELTQALNHEDYQRRETDVQAWSHSPSHDERTIALFANVQGRLAKPLSLSAGFRHDYNYLAGEPGGFGHLNTFRTALLYTPSPGHVLKTIVAEAFQAPPPFQKFAIALGIREVASPDLKPERLHSAELMYDWDPGERVQGSLNLYRTRIDNVIAQVPVVLQGVSTKKFQNQGDLEIRGMELEFRYKFEHRRAVTLNATTASAKNPNTGFKSGDIAPFKANLVFEAQPSRLFALNLRLHFSSARDTVTWRDPSPFALRRVPAATTLDGSLTWFTPLKGLEVRLNAFNILNRENYEPGARDADGKTYNAAILQPGARGTLTALWRF